MPMRENVALTRRVAEMAASACSELFLAYGVALEPASCEWEHSNERMLCGVVGFVGRGVRGTCMLAGDDAPIVTSCPEGDRVRDWIGELTNQLAGRLKAKFLKHGLDVALTTPISLAGVRVQPLPRGDLTPMCFRAVDGSVMVWVEVDSEPRFLLGEEQADHNSRTEGDIVIF